MNSFRVVIALLIFFFCGCKNKGGEAMTDQKSQTVCVGRHLIDLPAGFVLMMPLSATFHPLGSDEQSMPIEINVLDAHATPEIFATALKNTSSKLAAASRGDTDVLESVSAIGSDSTLFRVQAIEDSYVSDLHLLKNNVYLIAKAESYHGHFQQAETALYLFSKNLRGPQTTGVNQPGFCLGPIHVLGTYKTEIMSLLMRNPAQPDITITIDIDTYGRDEAGTLLQRTSGPHSLLEIFNVHPSVIRKGELLVAGMQAQEWLASAKLGENGDEKQFKFGLETRRSKPGPSAPHIHIELETGQNDQDGNANQNSLSNQQAIALWDSMVKSIRLRPGADL